MALEDYRSKRDLRVTPEPAPRVESSPAGDLFVVQKHAARRLHYDLRLELDGVLKSWAVPKGPSLDPGEKRLAVQVEDHPLEYAEFEGVIPQGEYGAGTVMVWDRGAWQPVGAAADDPEAAYRKGELKFRLEGEKLRGGWMLVRLKPREGEDAVNWLLFKERDEEARGGAEAEVTSRETRSVKTGRAMEEIAAEADRVWSTDRAQPREQPREAVERLKAERAPPPSGDTTPRSSTSPPSPAEIEGARRALLPETIEPELATLVAQPPDGDDWLYEVKFDGYRVLCRIEDGVVRMLTRRGSDWTTHFPTLPEPLRQVPARQALLDGEVVHVGEDGRTDFRRLASALQGGTDPEGRIVYYVFDLLHLDGYDLTQAPLQARKQALERLLAGFGGSARVRYVDHVQGEGPEFYAQACKLALEGVVAKRRESAYRPGRGRDWVKVKCLRRQEFIVVGFTERARTAGAVGALLLGYRDKRGGAVRYAGRVGTGWDHAAMLDLRRRLDALVQNEPPCTDPPLGRAVAGVRWVRPELVAEIEYLAWNGRDAFRHPSFEGLRLDKPSAEVVIERPQTLGPPDARASRGERPAAPAPRDRPKPSGAPSRGGRRAVANGVIISNADRVVYPDLGITKLDVARYYAAVGERMLPHMARRPLTLVRCPEGRAKQCFFQKRIPEGVPDSVLRVPLEEDDQTSIFMAVDSLEGLLALVQLGALEFHVWGSHLEHLERPDRIVFDLDPDPALPFARVVDAAQLMHALLRGLGLASFVKTTGGKGLHLVVPIEPTRSWDEVKTFTKAIAEAVVRADPEHYVATMSLKKRPGRIFIDYFRNGRGATFVTAYSTRRGPGAAVSTPLRWDELSGRVRADRYTLGNLRRRLAALDEDPWAGLFGVRQCITADMGRAVGVKLETGA